MACAMMTRNQVMVYRHLLQFIQEEVKREGKNPMIMWLYDMNVRTFLANRSEYDNTSFEEYMKTFSAPRIKPQWRLRSRMSPLTRPHSTKKQEAPPNNFGKPEWEKPRINLTKADDLVAQTANTNKSFWDKTRAAKRQKNGIKENAVADKKEVPQKPSGEGRKFWDKGGNELKGNTKRDACTAWQRSTPEAHRNEGGGGWYNPKWPK